MSARRDAVFILAMLVFLVGQTLAHAQGKFGKPVAVDQGPKPPDEFGLLPPTPEQLFRVQSEQAMKKRLRQDLPQVKNVDFPKEGPPLPAGSDPDLTMFPAHVFVSPNAGQVCYRPLYFEDAGTDRFGDYVPCLQPLISAKRFYMDLLSLPCRMWLAPPWTFECDNR